MSTITDELNVLKAIFDLMVHDVWLDDFIGKDEVDSRLRWAAKNTAEKINRLSNLNG